MSDIQSVAVYGLGNMGLPLAERIARCFPVRVGEPDAARCAEAVRSFGARPIEGPQDLSDVSVVVLSLPTPAISQSVLAAIAPSLRRGAVVVETSTVNPSDVQAAARLLQPYDIALVDASVMAGVSQMQAGSATLAIGGSSEAIDHVQPVLDAIADKQIRFGATGSGAAAKVINNAVAHAVMVVVAEAGSMATAAGIDCNKLLALLSDKTMGLHRPLTYRYAERIRNADYAGGMPLDAARKDSVLALELAQQLGVPIFAIQGSHTVYELGVAAGYGRDDYAAIARLWDDWGRPAVPPASRRADPG